MPSESPGVLVVDDSPFIRRVVADVVRDDAGYTVLGEAADGAEAVRLVHALLPAVVTLDLEMPGLGGLDALGYIMSECPRPVVVLTGREDAAGEDLALRALELGAVDFVRKPSCDSALDLETLRRRLTQALHAALQGRADPPRRAPARPWRKTPGLTPLAAVTAVPATRLIVIAASTGGPRTLTELLPSLPVMPDTAWVVVQHMPASFTGSFARRLNELGTMPVSEVAEGMPLVGAHIYVAPGGIHTIIDGRPGEARLRFSDAAAVHGVRPAADICLESASRSFGRSLVTVVLTGMGRDGAAGARATRERGGCVVVQTPESCVVAGMPQAVLQLLEPDEVATPDALPEVLRALCAESPAGARG